MKKLPFVIIRLLAASFVVLVCFFVLKLDSIYLMVIGIAAYAIFDILGYPLYNFLKSQLRLAPASVAGPDSNNAPVSNSKAAPAKAAPAIVSNPNDIMSFLSLNRRLDFVIYFDAPAKSEHQVLMWIPYLSALRRNYVIVLRSKTYEKIFKKYALPVVVLPKLAELEKIIKAKVKFAFYVNNGMRNTHMVRYNEITHIQLLHGDSDKPASYNPISVMYDYLFVAGEMAIDRYANNDVKVPNEKFEIVGRPQTEELGKLIDRQGFLDKTIKTVLYTTTWSGFQESANFSSIRYSKDIVERLISMGFRVIFRPHPHSYGDAEQAAVINEIATFLMEQVSESGIGHCVSNNAEFGHIYKSSTACINAADVLLSDVSSMVSDWLYTAKPFIMVDTHKDKNSFIAENPLAAGGYYIDTELNDFEEVLNDVCDVDPLWEERLETRLYALGMTLTDDPLEKFVSVVNEVFARHELDEEEE